MLETRVLKLGQKMVISWRALALSLIKRAADIMVGVPGLVAWHALETRRFNRRGKRA